MASLDMKRVHSFPVFGHQSCTQADFFRKKVGVYTCGLVDEGKGRNHAVLWSDREGATSGAHMVQVLWGLLLGPHKIRSSEETLVLRMDNCGVNKNWKVFSFLSCLVHWRYFKRIKVSFGEPEFLPPLFNVRQDGVDRIDLSALLLVKRPELWVGETLGSVLLVGGGHYGAPLSRLA